jgi:ELWxxDGT repeat protein
MKNSKRGPLSWNIPITSGIRVLFTLKMVASLLFALAFTAAKAQPLTLVKDINTPQIADLKNAIFYAVGNKVYYSDATGIGTKLVYTGAANATIEVKVKQIYTGDPYFFVETTPTSAKILRYNFVTIETIATGTTITFVSSSSSIQGFGYVVNGNQLWLVSTGAPKLIKTFATPIKYVQNNFLATTNSLWAIDYVLGTATLIKDGFTDIGEFGGSEFAANDGGFNGTELWTATAPSTAYLLKDLNPGPPSSNPRNFVQNYFTATSERQNHIYIRTYDSIYRVISAPIGSDIKVVGGTYTGDASGNAVSSLIYVVQTANLTTVNTFEVNNTNNRKEIARFTEGSVVFDLLKTGLFTHLKANGTSELWALNTFNNTAYLSINNAGLEDVYGLNYVAGKDGKLWRLEGNTLPVPTTLVQDFGSNAQISIKGERSVASLDGSNYRRLVIFTRTINGVTTTYTVEYINSTNIVNEVSANTFTADQYPSYPNTFYEINGKVLFNATDGENGQELWRTDGTTAGTSIFKAFYAGPYGGVGRSFKDNGFVYYDFEPTYWKTDGTTIDSIRANTAEYQTVKNRFKAGTTAPNLTVGTTKYQTYYSGYNACGRGCPYIVNGGIQRIVGTDTAFVFSFNFTGNGPEAIKSLQPFGNKFYFTFTQSTPSAARGALWVSDGTAAGTTIIAKFVERPSDITLINGKMYFTADDGTNGTALWSSDGTTAGTTVVAYFKTATYVPQYPFVNQFYVQGNSLYFLVSRRFTGDSATLWSHRIGSNSMGKIADFNTVSSITGNNNVLFNGALYLPQTNPQVGTELFKFPLQEAPVGNPLSNQADLALTQTVTQTQTRDTVFLNFNLTVKNNGAQTAKNVLTNFVGLGAYYFFGTSNFRDTVASLGFLSTPFTNQTTWTIPTLNNGQSATLRFTTPILKQFYQRSTVYTNTSSDQFDGNFANNTAEYMTELIVEPCSGSVADNLLVDYYVNQTTETSPIVIQNPNAPSGQYLLNGTSDFSTLGDQYIRRARGYLKPTETGSYKFYIAGDDNVDVYLSTDDNPTNKQRIAYVNGYTSFSDFNKFASQTSATINLVAGRQYYLEIVNADKFGSDFFNLQWATPTIPARNLIPAENVESFCGSPVAALPDLTLQNLVVRDPSVSAGQNINYTVDAKNIGTANATTGLNFKTFLSNDQTLDANDVQVGLSLLPTLNAGQTLSGVAGQISTSAALTGTFYVILKIDPENTVAEGNENNNTLVSASTVTIRPNVAALPDLTLENLRLGSLTFQQGQTLTGEVQINNGGLARANAFNVVFFLSRDNIASIEDLQGVYSTESFLDATTATNRIGSISIPSNFPIGQYYLILKVDPNNQIAESNEDNNTLIATNLITITAAPNTGTYCASKGVAPWEYAISNVNFNTLNNNSDKFKDFNTLGFSDYTNLSTTLTKGQTYPLSITPLLSWNGNLPNAYARVWIDYNQNKIFEANELVLERTNANPLTQNVLIPSTAIVGTTRMRVSLKNGAYPTACEAFDKGEVEDYTVTIGDNNLCATDVTPPIIANCPRNFERLISNGGSNITFNEPTATDNCGLQSFVGLINNGRTSFQGTNGYFAGSGVGNDTIVYTATDNRNNKATCTFIVKKFAYATFAKSLTANIPRDTTVYTNADCAATVWTAPLIFISSNNNQGPTPSFDLMRCTNLTPFRRVIRDGFSYPIGGFDSLCLPVGRTTLNYVADYGTTVFPADSTLTLYNLTVPLTYSFTINVVRNATNLPDLTLANLSPRDPSVSQGQNVNFTFDAKNIGTGNATNAFTIKSYLSTDAVLDASDYQNGSIPTANYAAGATVSQIVGALNVANTVAVGNYYLILKIDADNQIAESNETNNVLVSSSTIAVTAVVNSGNYCASKGVAPWEYAISNVSLNTLNNTSDKFKDFNTLGYSDYTNLLTTLTKGQSYTLSITPLLSWIGNLPNVYARVWIDFNQNKTFEANELVLEKTNANPLTQNVLIPTTALTGATRMRVSLKNGGYPTACEAFDKGEVEDYTVTIQDGTGGGNLPDLTLANLNVTGTSVAQGGVVNFKFDAKNIGTGDVANAFTIKSYLSTDAVLDANDYQNGSIPTANYAAGASILQIVGAMQVENTVAAGNYFVILKVDADNVITESNESNNMLVSTSTIAVTTAPSGGTSDIALTISGDPSVYRQYSTQNFRISAKNNGSTAFTNVKIKFSRPALTVSGGTKVASVGTFQDFCPNSVECSEWTIPTLAANTTATLDVPTYVLNPTAAITATATLLASTPVDNVTANNTATVSINRSTTPAVQPLVQSKPTQLIPVVIQRINPTLTENYIVVELESLVDKQIEFHILNALGTVVLTEKMTIEKGNNKRQFDVSQLPKGLYLIQTSVGQGQNVPMKFVKY